MISKCFIKGIVLFIPLLLLSCNEKEEAIVENKCKIICSVDKFESSNPSRTNTDPNNNYLITWASGDVIGIFPKQGYQEPFEIPANQVGNVSTTFDGGYWAVKDGLQYNAYYPFDKRNFESAGMKTRIPVTYKGQKQNGTSCDIGAFDYTYSDWKTATNGSIGFSFHHLGSINVFNLKYPATTTYIQMTLSVDEALIPLEGSYDLTAKNVAMKADENSLSTSISLDLTNCSGVAGETGTFYMMLPPMDLSNNKVTVSLTSAAGTTCTYSIENDLNIEKGMKYERTGIPIESNVEGTVDGWLQSYYSNGVAFVAKAGELSSIIPEDEKYTITSLKISGELNGTDIRFIRDMLGRDANNGETNGKLANLDLMNATIVEGDDPYLNTSFTTSDNQIGQNMFCYCKTLQSIVLPTDIESIGYNAFNYCTSLNSITIGSKVTSIASDAFSNCNNLENVYIDNLEAWCKIDFKYYNSNPLFLGAKLFIDGQLLTELVIPESITSVLKYTFEGCSSITKVTLSDNCISIGDSSFKDSSLTEIVLGEQTVSIESNAFYGCTALTNVEFSNDLKSIGSFAFKDCDALNNVVLSNNTTLIGESAFYDCSSLTKVVISGYCNIEQYAFYNCDALADVEIGTGNTSIGIAAFYACDALTSVTIGNGKLTIGKYAFSDCVALANFTFSTTSNDIGENAFKACALTEVDITEGKIGAGAFVNCKSLQYVSLGNNVTELGRGTFSNCVKLQKVIVGNGISSIENSTFSNCQSLSTVSLGKNVSQFGTYVFQNAAITNFYCYGSTPPTYGAYCFTNAIEEGAVLHVPVGCLSAYELWRNHFSTIKEMEE